MEYDDWVVKSVELTHRVVRVVVEIGSRSGVDDLAVWCALIESLLTAGGADVVSCDVAHLDGSAGAVIHALVRLQLTARRCGGGIELFRPPPALLELLRIAGLTDVLPVSDPLGGESARYAEEREQCGIDEGVDADDAAG